MVDVAKAVGADAVAHGCTGKGNDQACIAVLKPLTLHHRSYLLIYVLISSYQPFLSICLGSV